MDRPEWIDTFPDSLTAVATLTNNTPAGSRARTRGPACRTRASTPPTRASTPPERQPYGHIITWSYRQRLDRAHLPLGHLRPGRQPGRPGADGSTINGDIYGSPDGIYVAPSGRLWIQTDVSGSTINRDRARYAAFGNNQMLCSDPATTRSALPGRPERVRDHRRVRHARRAAMFVGIQHPGEAPSGRQRPGQPEAVQLLARRRRRRPPRSACVLITKDDGGQIG